jgi:hypothetical protein
MVSILSTYTSLGVGWYLNNGASRHTTYDRKIFNKFQEKEKGMIVDLGEDAMYLVKGLGSISFHMPSGDVMLNALPNTSNHLICLLIWHLDRPIPKSCLGEASNIIWCM